MGSRAILENVRHLFRTKHFGPARQLAAEIAPGAEHFAEAQVLGVRCLLGATRFRTAAAAAHAAVRQETLRADEAAVLRLVAAGAEMLARPSVESLEAVKRLAASFPAGGDPLWRAHACMFDARRVAVAVTLQVRSIHGLDEARELLAQAANLFDATHRPLEAWDERAMLADLVQNGPPPRPDEAARLWDQARETARANDDPAGLARAALASASWPDLRRALRRESARPEARGRPVVLAHFVWPLASDPLQHLQMLVSRGDWELPRVADLEVSPAALLNFAEPCFGGAGNPLSTLRGFLEDAGGDAAWRDGFAALVAPLARWTEPGDIVCLIPHGPLHGLPLHALDVDGTALAERNAVFYSPSAAVFLSRVERERGQSAGTGQVAAAVFGCSLPAGALSPLPRAVEEARFVARQPWLRVARGPCLDADVTGENLRAALPGAAVVHFVGHAVEDAAGWESALVLAGGERMTARDFTRTRLRADLVALSGCRTARSRVRPGDEALGLTPALLYAGASSVLASHWEAQERPAESLMGRFYELVYGAERLNKAEAWRRAVRCVREVYPALADWAPFILQGDWK